MQLSSEARVTLIRSNSVFKKEKTKKRQKKLRYKKAKMSKKRKKKGGGGDEGKGTNKKVFLQFVLKS